MIFKPSPVFVDAVINHADVRATAEQGSHRLASGPVLASPENVVLAYDGGVAVFLGLGQGVYEGHIYALPTSRGAKALCFGKRAITALFTDHRALKLVAAVPYCLPAARLYCRRLGLKPEGRDLFNEYFQVESVSWVV